MAAPQVAGAVALVRAANPRLRRTAVVRLMKQTATRAPGGGWTTELGWGILNAGGRGAAGARARGRTRVPPKTSRRGGRSRSVRRAGSRCGGAGATRLRPASAPAGIESYSVYVKRGGRYKLIADHRRGTGTATAGRRGKRYSFFVRARDLAGNVEPTAPAPSFVVRRAALAAGGLSKLRPWPSGPRTILLAAPRGYCAGVDRAVQTVEKALDLYGPPVYVRKEIVHNKHVVESLEQRGAIFVDEETEVPEGETVVFSAHGVAPSVHANAAAARA